MIDATHTLELTELELTELLAGIDCLQTADNHAAEVCFPLRNKLRGLLFPEAAAPTAEAVGEAPAVDVHEDTDAGPEAADVATKAE